MTRFRPNFLSLLAREYSIKIHNSAAITESQIKIARERSEEILEKFSTHEASNHDFFSYLKSESTKGFCAGQFVIYRDNFLYRTQQTIISAALHAAKAIENNDFKAAVSSAKNVTNEGGHGKIEDMHLKLLEDSHNLHGKRIYGLPEIRISDAKNSPFLTEAAKDFRKTQNRLFRSSYSTLTGCLLAHEGAADDMLVNFREAFFDPYKGYYTEKEFKNLVRYYDVHRNDSIEGGKVEERHKEEALEVVSEIILRNPRAQKTIFEGGKKFLDAQALLWTSLMTDMKNAKSNGQIVLPKYDFLPEALPATPSTEPSPKKTESLQRISQQGKSTTPTL